MTLRVGRGATAEAEGRSAASPGEGRAGWSCSVHRRPPRHRVLDHTRRQSERRSGRVPGELGPAACGRPVRRGDRHIRRVHHRLHTTGLVHTGRARGHRGAHSPAAFRDTVGRGGRTAGGERRRSGDSSDHAVLTGGAQAAGRTAGGGGKAAATGATKAPEHVESTAARREKDAASHPTGTPDGSGTGDTGAGSAARHGEERHLAAFQDDPGGEAPREPAVEDGPSDRVPYDTTTPAAKTTGTGDPTGGHPKPAGTHPDRVGFQDADIQDAPTHRHGNS